MDPTKIMAIPIDDDIESEEGSEEEDTDDENELDLGLGDLPVLSDDEEEDEEEDEDDEEELVSDDDASPPVFTTQRDPDFLARLATFAVPATNVLAPKTVAATELPGLVKPQGLVGTASAKGLTLNVQPKVPTPPKAVTLNVQKPPVLALNVQPKAPAPVLTLNTQPKVPTPPKPVGIPQLAGLAAKPAAPAVVAAPKPTVDVTGVLAKLPGVTIAGVTPGVAPVTATLDDLLRQESSESVEDFAARKVLTQKLVGLPSLGLNNSAAVVLGQMLYKKTKYGVTYSPEVEVVLSHVLAQL